jgi:hypothetical protein
MSKPERLSSEAAAATTEDRLWGLFFSEEIVDKMVHYTNDSIQEDIDQQRYTLERLRVSPYIKFVDKVTFCHFIASVVDLK